MRHGAMTRITSSIAALAFAAPFVQTAPPPPSLSAAVAKLAAQDVAGATVMLEAIVRAEPANGRAWRILASAYQQSRRFDDAIAADRKSLDVDPSMPAPLFSLGTLYALKGDGMGFIPYVSDRGLFKTATVAFLASDAAGYVTGSTVYVDGGANVVA